MRRLLRALTRRMAVKIFLATAFIVGQSLVVLAWLQARDQVKSLKKSTEVAAAQVADLVVGSIEYAMLQGDGVTVKQLVRGFKQDVPRAEIRIFDRRGLEVFGEAAPAPKPSELPGPLRAALGGVERAVADGRVWRGIPNEERCHDCHDADEQVRGVLSFARNEAVLAQKREDVATSLVRAGFLQIMTARQAKNLDDYFAELSRRAPTIVAVGVYDKEGDLAFGKDVPGLSTEQIHAALQPGAERARLPTTGGTIQLVPLPKEERCKQCHKDDSPVRGVLAIGLANVPAGDHAADEEVEVVVDASVRAIMMSSLGRIIADYLRDVSATGAVTDLRLYDDHGALWFDAAARGTDPTVLRALASADMPPMLVGGGRGERVLFSRQLKNGPRCTTCHGADHAVRGVVMVSLPNDQALMVREQAISRTAVLSSIALVAALLLIYVLFRSMVERPVREIGAAADAIGQGDLSVAVASADPEGDELARLGTRINEMIRGLRSKLVLEKFVSKGAAAAADAGGRAVLGHDVATQGERRDMVVLFSDIRGFTAFSETRSPEQVVEMLNQLLEAQAHVVDKHGGDIDKFVGDELMAVFHGADAARRAVRCGVEMIEAVAALNRTEQLAVGVGISSGGVVYGPIGSMNRLDFTVIGDVVNTGARLCSAAEGGQVIVTRQVVDDCGGALDGFEFAARAPLRVKNKKEPLETYAATRRGA